jgi:hypothetical protein
MPSGANITKRVDLMLEYCASRLKWGHKPSRHYYSEREIEIYREIKALCKKKVSKNWEKDVEIIRQNLWPEEKRQ